MHKKLFMALVSVCLVSMGIAPAFGSPVLYEWTANVDGALGAAADVSQFDQDLGLGTISFTIDGAGDHFIGVFVDHELSEEINIFFNEYGLANGALQTGQSWEIDEPGWLFGDIYDNLEGSDGSGSLLDNSSSLTEDFTDDASMALGWNFTLADGETASISFILSQTLDDILSAFYLAQIDVDSGETLYFASAIEISGNPVPEPATMLLFGTGLLGLCAVGRKRIKTKMK